MQTVLDYLLPGTITAGVLAAILLPIAKPFIERFIERRVDHGFDLRLEEHKQKLTVLTESAKFDLQRRLTSANLYTTRRHQVYVEVYQALRIAHGIILSQRGFRQALTFEEFNVSDIEAYLQERGAPKGFITEIADLWLVSKDEGRKKLKPYLAMLERQEAERKFGEAKNTLYMNELYFSDEIVEACNLFVDKGALALADLELPEPGAWATIKRDFTAALDSIHAKMREELAG